MSRRFSDCSTVSRKVRRSEGNFRCITNVDTSCIALTAVHHGDGQNQIAIRLNRGLNRVDDSLQTLQDSIWVACNTRLIRFRTFGGKIEETRDGQKLDILHDTRIHFF